MDYDAKAVADGARTARMAIAKGVPRWIETPDNCSGDCIDRNTGLPNSLLGGPKELHHELASFAHGHNSEILRAKSRGEISIDFRPLLMSPDEVERSLTTHNLGVLSLDNPKIESSLGQFILEIQLPKRRFFSKADDTVWISYRHSSGGKWPDFSVYEGPIEVALGHDGRVLVLENDFVCTTHDVVTTQLLNRYSIDDN